MPCRRQSNRTPAPEALQELELVRLEAWCGAKHPRLAPRVRYLVETMLLYHGAKGTLMRDWYKAAQTWIRNEAEGRFSRVPVEPQRPRPPAIAMRDTDPAVAELARRREVHRLKLIGR